MLLKTKDRCGKLRDDPGMFMKTKDLAVAGGNVAENKCTYPSFGRGREQGAMAKFQRPGRAPNQEAIHHRGHRLHREKPKCPALWSLLLLARFSSPRKEAQILRCPQDNMSF
jgi:hypothetical protein